MFVSHPIGIPGVHLLTLSSDVSKLELSPDAAGIAVLVREEFVVDIKGMHPLQVTGLCCNSVQPNRLSVCLVCVCLFCITKQVVCLPALGLGKPSETVSL